MESSQPERSTVFFVQVARGRRFRIHDVQRVPLADHDLLAISRQFRRS